MCIAYLNEKVKHNSADVVFVKDHWQEVSDHIVVPWLLLKDNVKEVAEVTESSLKHENTTKQTLSNAEEVSANKANSNKSDQSSRKSQVVST
jgi:hypothetical protein